MTIKYYPEVKKGFYTANIVNYNDPNLRKLNLEPFYATLYPIYFNSFGELAYLFSREHHNTKITTYIEQAIGAFELKNEKRFDTSFDFFTFAVVNNTVYLYSPIIDLMPYIKNEIEDFLGGPLEFIPAPEMKNISSYRNYKEYLLSIPGVRTFYINLSIAESLLIWAKRFYFPKTAEELTFSDVADATNYRADFFNSDNFNLDDNDKILGVYNHEALKMINSIFSTRASIYKRFYDTSVKSENPQIFIKTFKKYYSPIIFEDIMIMFFGFDKIDYRQRNRNLSELYVQNPEYFCNPPAFSISQVINTSKSTPFELFFNYLITGDFELKLYNKVDFCPKSNDFVEIDRNDFLEPGSEREFQREIALIRRLVPKEDVDKYMI